MNIILDTSVILSFYDDTDINHKKALKDLDSFQEDDLWITEHVLNETLYLLQKKDFKVQLKRFLNLLNQEIITVFDPLDKIIAQNLREKSLEIFINQKNTRATYTDIYSVALSNLKYIPNSSIFSYDHHLSNLQKSLKTI